MAEKKTEKKKVDAAKSLQKLKRSSLSHVPGSKAATPKLAQTKREIAKAAQNEQAVDAFGTLRYVMMTEKSIQLVESQNKIVFIVHRNATKNDVKRAVEDAFSARVREVKTLIDQDGRKKAFVRFAKDGEAGEIAIKLGII